MAIVKLPLHVDQIYKQNQEFSEQIRNLQNSCQMVREDLQDEFIKLQENVQSESVVLQKSILILQQEKEELQKDIHEVENQMQDLLQRSTEQQRILQESRKSLQQELNALKSLQMDGKYFERLRLLLSIHPVLWGEEERLHISDLAAVFTCFFNTNSGSITVGDYTFAGSGVSILAGSHDQHLKGLLRRDAEITEGCDIKIGKGVWLASNSTILGPATIGDNAVIAAGAVVVPGTVIPENAIYAGIPAKCIGMLELEDAQDTTNPAILRAIERNNGVLYVEGWTEKRERRINGILYRGHEQVKDIAVIYTIHSLYRTFYECDKDTTLYYKIDNDTMQEISIKEGQGTIDIVLDEKERLNERIHVIEFTIDTSSGLFLGVEVEE